MYIPQHVQAIRTDRKKETGWMCVMTSIKHWIHLLLDILGERRAAELWGAHPLYRYIQDSLVSFIELLLVRLG